MGEFSPQHYCFHVSEKQFDTILDRLVAKGIPYRCTPMGPVDMQVRQQGGGRNLYWGAGRARLGNPHRQLVEGVASVPEMLWARREIRLIRLCG